MDRKKILRRSIEVGIIIVLIVVFVIVNILIKEEIGRAFIPLSDNSKYAYQVETLTIEEDELVLRGWFVETKKVRNVEVNVNEEKTIGIILYDIDSEIEKDIDGNDKPRKGVEMDISFQTRNDINDYLKCEYDYSKCGFTARVDKSLVRMDNNIYQIVFRLDKKGTVYSGLYTNSYIDNGKLVFRDNNMDMALDVKNTDLEDIVYKGVCLVNDNSNHVCIYQYGKTLYWIVDNQFMFENNNRTLVQCILETSQFDKLPSERIDMGLFYGDISDYFEDCEITKQLNCGKYRVMIKELPMEYSITYITTRLRNGNIWVWERKFRPNYMQMDRR